MQLFPFLLLASTASTTLAWSHLFDRAPPGCLADNCLRAITGTAAGQTQTKVDRAADCSNFLVQTVTPSTITITATVSVTLSTTSSSTTTTTTTASFTQSTSLSFTTTTTTTASAIANGKRTASAGSSSNTIPAYASPCTSAARYSSACSCAGWLPSTVTAAVPTVITTISTTLTNTIDITSTLTTVSSTTLIDTIEITSTSTSTTVSTPTQTLPTACASQTISFPAEGDNGNLIPIYTQVFAGTGFSEDPDNSSSEGHDGVITTFDATMDACEAAVACAQWAFASSLEAHNIDVHFAITENQWVCIGYQLGLSTDSDYDIADTDIGAAMGYNFLTLLTED